MGGRSGDLRVRVRAGVNKKLAEEQSDELELCSGEQTCSDVWRSDELETRRVHLLRFVLTLQPPTNKITLPPQIITNIQKERQRGRRDAEELGPDDSEALEL